METYFFKDLQSAGIYIYRHLENPTPIKIQKSLYFIWAFYAATYGKSSEDSSKSELNEIQMYPTELFQANFEAWKYGPVISSIWSDTRDGKLDVKEEELSDDDLVGSSNDITKKEVFGYINDFLKEIDSINDFALVSRSHQDNSWFDEYSKAGEDEHHIPMDGEKIKKEYIEYIKKQGEI